MATKSLDRGRFLCSVLETNGFPCLRLFLIVVLVRLAAALIVVTKEGRKSFESKSN